MSDFFKGLWKLLTYDSQKEMQDREEKIFNTFSIGKRINYLGKSITITDHSYSRRTKYGYIWFLLRGRYIDNAGIIRTVDIDFLEAEHLTKEVKDD